MKIYYRILRDFTAAKILAGLVVDSERYELKYEFEHESIQKDIDAAILIAEHFVSEVKK